jgi:DNA-binding MarR family transcriptional regulator
MAGRLRREVRQRKDPPLEEEAYGNVLRTAALLLAGEARILEAWGLTPVQHNVLRILRGAGSGGLRVGEIMERLLTPEPDGTRLVDRLADKGLAQRSRDEEDGRAVRVVITEAGLRALAEADVALRTMLDRCFGLISKPALRGMIDVLEEVRGRFLEEEA